MRAHAFFYRLVLLLSLKFLLSFNRQIRTLSFFRFISRRGHAFEARTAHYLASWRDDISTLHNLTLYAFEKAAFFDLHIFPLFFSRAGRV